MSMKPILFNDQMVRAILDGRKTQTRRVCKVSSRSRNIENKECKSVIYPSSNMFGICADFYDMNGFWRGAAKPLYKPGDILYVREAWKNATGDPAGGGYALFDTYVYRADGKAKDDYPIDCLMVEDRWHPSIHMPKEAARIFLRIINIRVERLQDAEECDIEDEGYMGCPNEHTVYFPEGGAEPCLNIEGECPYHGWYCNHSLAEGFGRDVWDETIKPEDLSRYGWDANPWVWVISFEKIDKEEAMES